jgi:hypothetical protein
MNQATGVAPGDPKVFVLQRELSEVHLLIDNLSAKPDCGLTKLKDEAAQAGLPEAWVKAICDIDWPPEDAREAEQAALLIRAKDFLNLQTSPATGMTIAFTLLVTQEDEETGLRRWWHKLVGQAQPAAEAVPSRNQLARNAYPGLVGKARGFRRWILGISVFLLGWLLLTCVLSWYVAYGNAVLTQLTSARDASAAAQKRIYEADTPQRGRTPASDDVTPAPAEPAGALEGAALGRGPVVDFCLRGFQAATDAAPARYESVQQMQLCEERAAAQKQADAIQKTLIAWKNWPDRVPVLNWFLSPKSWEVAEPDVALYATSIANVLGTGVLPVFYGILGAGAAIVRLLSRKIRRSTLSPRDLNLAFQQLALGAVIGACIGLFVGGGEDGLLGPVALSGTALSFVAGFGVEQVFTALEQLLQRIFATSPPQNAGSGQAG